VKTLYHVAQASAFDPEATHYAPTGWEAEGFIHCCWASQLSGVLARYFRGQKNLMLLTLDASALARWLKEEDSTGRGEAFPHCYGVIPRSAVLQCQPLATDDEGRPLQEIAQA
jgi:Uncharacterized protein conserved in bacteria